MPSKVVSVGAWDTVLHADSVEFVPRDHCSSCFVCGTYQLLENFPEKERIGRITLHNTDFGSDALEPLCTVETPGVLDLKFNRKLAEETPLLLASANAAGHLAVYAICAETPTISLLSSQPVVAEGLALACDWSHHSSSSLTVSDSKGCVSLVQYHQDQPRVAKTWKAHDYEAWTTAFDPSDENLIYSGGDDCLWKGWDARMEGAVFTNRQHAMGVTCIQGSTHHGNVLATGSYDEQLRIWDKRRLKTSLVELGVGGGLWRIKWEPWEGNYLLVGAMHNGFHIVQYKPDKALQLNASFMEHGSLAYGCDWSWNRSLGTGKRGLASCSFYDHLLKSWTWENEF